MQKITILELCETFRSKMIPNLFVAYDFPMHNISHQILVLELKTISLRSDTMNINICFTVPIDIHWSGSKIQNQSWKRGEKKNRKNRIKKWMLLMFWCCDELNSIIQKFTSSYEWGWQRERTMVIWNIRHETYTHGKQKTPSLKIDLLGLPFVCSW